VIRDWDIYDSHTWGDDEYTNEFRIYNASWKKWNVMLRDGTFWVISPDNCDTCDSLAKFDTPEKAIALAEKLQAVIDADCGEEL
jgi:hypothetical protein